MIEDRIIEVRESNDLKQREMAEILDVKRSTYAAWEIGQNTISLDYVNKIANYFNISMDYLGFITNTKDKKIKHNELNLKELGRRLRISRKLAKLTQQDISSKFNTTQSVLSSYENGKVMIQTIFIIEWAKLTNTSIDWLCCKTEDKEIH